MMVHFINICHTFFQEYDVHLKHWYRVPIFDSSKFSIWPLYLIINKLPDKLRIKKKNMILAGLWFGPHGPSPNWFMNTFREELKKLYKGVKFIISNTQNVIRVHGLVISGTGDLLAKALFLNINQFNRKFGCPCCKIEISRVNNV